LIHKRTSGSETIDAQIVAELLGARVLMTDEGLSPHL
jgi:hypothetical protein